MKLPGLTAGFLALVTLASAVDARASGKERSKDEHALLKLEQNWINAEGRHNATAPPNTTRWPVDWTWPRTCNHLGVPFTGH